LCELAGLHVRARARLYLSNQYLELNVPATGVPTLDLLNIWN